MFPNPGADWPFLLKALLSGPVLIVTDLRTHSIPVLVCLRVKHFILDVSWLACKQEYHFLCSFYWSIVFQTVVVKPCCVSVTIPNYPRVCLVTLNVLKLYLYPVVTWHLMNFWESKENWREFEYLIMENARTKFISLGVLLCFDLLNLLNAWACVLYS